jgi:N-acetylmuramoyl-L-alanine amidase
MICRLLLRRHELISLLIPLVFGLFLVSSSHAAPPAASSAAKLLHEAQEYSRKLYQSSSKKKYRHNWERCIKRYERIYKAFPNTDEAVIAMFTAGELWTNLSRYSSRSSDLDRAIVLYRDLVERYKNHKLADDAQYRLGEIFYRYKKDTKQAYIEFLKVEIKFPDGDIRAEASKRLTELERILGKRRGSTEKIIEDKSTIKQLIPVKDIRHWSTPTYTRVVIDLENPVKYKGHLLKRDPDLKKPRRLYVDLLNTEIKKDIETSIPIKDELLRGARAAQYNRNTVRVVLDIDNMEGYKIFHLYDPFRIVIDVQGEQSKVEPEKRMIAEKPPTTRETKDDTQKEISLAKQLGLGVKRIIIDAGHGGKDPGALGRYGLREKDIVLQLANILAKKVREELKCEPLLTRGSDVFLPLEKRTAIANIKKADLFISLHVNAHKNRKVQGLETYFLNIALDEDSMNLAARENATSTKNISDLQMILNDLMLNTKINESSRLAEFVHMGLMHEVRKRYKNVENRGVRQAPFYVLIGADMPAILVEIGYITNSIENKRLRSNAYLNGVASGIVRGIDSYIKDMETTYKGG